MAAATRLAAMAASKIYKYGQVVTVERRSGGRNSTVTSQTLQCLPQPDRAAALSLMAEGGFNAASADPHRFVFSAGSDVAESTDTVLYNGNSYKVSRVTVQMVMGQAVAVHAFGLRASAGKGA